MTKSNDSEQQILSWLGTQHDAMIALLRTLVNTDSGSYDKAGVDAAGGHIREFLGQHGIRTEVTPDVLHAWMMGLTGDKDVRAFLAETRLVVAHELGHVRHRDVPHGLLWLALVAPFGTLVVARVAERVQRRDTTPVPAVLLALALTAPVLTTISNQLSRAVERRADAFAL